MLLSIKLYLRKWYTSRRKCILHKIVLNRTFLAALILAFNDLIIPVRAKGSSNITGSCSSVFVIDFEQVFVHLVDTEDSS